MEIRNFASPEKETLRGFFDGIASTYDPINSLLSFSLDEVWRRKAVRLVLGDGGEERQILDLGVGTGKFLKKFLGKRPWRLAVGVDFSGPMLRRAQGVLPRECRLVQADIHDLPFKDQRFDLVVSSFTLRSVKDRVHFFEEVKRVLRPKGRAAFLCLTRPTSFLGRALYAPYLKFYLPFMGGFLSSHRGAYRFLSESIQSFPSPREVGSELESLGFHKVFIQPFTFGISTLMGAVA